MQLFPGLEAHMTKILEAINTRESVILWVTIAPIMRINRLLREMAANMGGAGLGIRLIENHQTIEFPGGSRLIVASALDRNVVDRLRGITLSMALIDATAEERDCVKDLIELVIAPSLVDHEGKIYYV
jgi:hypothetical protein